jgi:hypothetical protein
MSRFLDSFPASLVDMGVQKERESGEILVSKSLVIYNRKRFSFDNLNKILYFLGVVELQGIPLLSRSI